MSGSPPGLVSVIVRSTGRATLEQTLESIDAQTYPACEIVLVDALGAGHRPLCQRPQRHSLRMVEPGQPLIRPLAANAGLDQARGALIGFLDEDDFLEPDHVANLVAASRAHGDAAVYSATRILMEDDRVSEIAATPFSLLALHYANFIYCASVLFPRRFLDLGCRFDATLEVLEDWDFWLQIAQHAPFQLVPLATANYRATTGTSGVSEVQGGRGDAFHRAWETMHSKWGNRAKALWAPIEPRLREAIRLHQTGELAGAMLIYREIQAMAPNEPSSLHALARAHLDRAELAEARTSCDIALKLAPRNGEFHLTRASIALAEGNAADARTHASLARSLAPGLAGAADQILAAARGPIPTAAPGSRNELCPCGSGKRRKHCCGLLQPPARSPV
jgi:hypothetical protein